MTKKLELHEPLRRLSVRDLQFVLMDDILHAPTDAAAVAHGNSIEHLGNVSAIVLSDTGHGKFEVVDGARRLAELRIEGAKSVPALIVDGPRNSALLARAALNMARGPNPMAEAKAIKALLNDGMSAKTIAYICGTNSRTIANRARLLDQPKELLNAFEEGRVTISTLDRFASMAVPEHKERALAVLRESGQLSQKDLAAVRRVATNAAQNDFFNNLGPAPVPSMPSFEQLKTAMKALIKNYPALETEYQMALDEAIFEDSAVATKEELV